MTSAVGLSCPDLGDFPPPTLETLPEAVARNVAIAQARTRDRIMALVKHASSSVRVKCAKPEDLDLTGLHPELCKDPV